MNKVIIGLISFLFLISFVSADVNVGVSNASNIRGVNIIKNTNTIFNNNTGSINNSIFWQGYTPQTYNITFIQPYNLLNQNCPIGMVVNGTYSNGSFKCTTSSGGGGTPAGQSTQIQFNNNGAFGASGTFYLNLSDRIAVLNNSLLVGDRLFPPGPPSNASIEEVDGDYSMDNCGFDTTEYRIYAGKVVNGITLYNPNFQDVNYTSSGDCDQTFYLNVSWTLSPDATTYRVTQPGNNQYTDTTVSSIADGDGSFSWDSPIPTFQYMSTTGTFINYSNGDIIIGGVSLARGNTSGHFAEYYSINDITNLHVGGNATIDENLSVGNNLQVGGNVSFNNMILQNSPPYIITGQKNSLSPLIDNNLVALFAGGSLISNNNYFLKISPQSISGASAQLGLSVRGGRLATILATYHGPGTETMAQEIRAEEIYRIGSSNALNYSLYNLTQFQAHQLIAYSNPANETYYSGNAEVYTDGIADLNNITTNNLKIRNATGWSNYAVCYLSDNSLGHCTSVVGVGGTCTCANN